MLQVKDKNKEDVDLLYNDIPRFMEKYQATIEIIVAGFVKKGMFQYADKDEIKQIINEKLLSKIIYKIQDSYNGTSFLSTYFSKVTSNLCLEIHRSRKVHDRKFHEADVESFQIPYEDKKIWSSMVIQGELNKLHAILNTYVKQGEKLKFLLKILFDISITYEDVLSCFINCNEADKNTICAFFENKSQEINDKEIYEFITPYLNKYEAKANSVDAVRKWMNLKMDEIIEVLNGDPKRSSYTKETFMILTQRYFEEAQGLTHMTVVRANE